MRLSLTLFVAVGLVASGCHKKDAVAPVSSVQTAPSDSPAAGSEPAQPGTAQSVSPPPSGSSKPPPAPAYVTARADNSLRQNVAGQADVFLTQQLRLFMQKNGRLPDSFADFVNSSLDSIPRPPEGKKWVIDIDSMQVKAAPVP